MLEAGPLWDPPSTATMLAWSYDSPRRGWGGAGRSANSTGDRRLGHRRRAVYAAPGRVRLVSRADAGRPHQPLGPHLAPLRSRRFPPAEPRRLGDDWPITYDDIKPYYDKLDRLIGIFGSMQQTASQRARRNFSAAAGAARHELLIKKACDELKIPSSRRDSRFSPGRTTAGRRATTADSAAAAARRIPTSRSPRC